ncbi:class I tRNA ligase family protein [Candidatus Woesebacteria bacterium]|nr:class I tRNA ligase family protein [Candidatus Woesebacteria bacterium]
MQLYDTYTKTKQPLPTPQDQPIIKLYTCGPTVYDYTHIGHARKYVMDDILKRSLQYLGYDVWHVMNITDVGHLSGDDDTGDDKLEKGAQKTGKTVWEVAQFYTNFFHGTMRALNIIPPDLEWNATDHVEEMIELVSLLQQKGYVYETDEALYFDTTLFPNYGKLSGQNLKEKMQAVRDDVYVDPQKKHSTDFSLWFKCVGRFANHTMQWDSPWGKGFPGWHIECSAISLFGFKEILDQQNNNENDSKTNVNERRNIFSMTTGPGTPGERREKISFQARSDMIEKDNFPIIDIHTGGIDHIPVHHENEIAQYEAATGQTFVKIWMHYAFLNKKKKKMSKSKNNFYTLDDVKKHDIDPLALRYLILQTHYRKSMNFTWEALDGAQVNLKRIYSYIISFRNPSKTSKREKNPQLVQKYLLDFKEALENDLNTAKALSVMWDVLNSMLNANEKLKLFYSFDKIFGLGFEQLSDDYFTRKWPNEILKLADQRLEARRNKDFQSSDELRKKIEKKGWSIEDTFDGYTIKKN